MIDDYQFGSMIIAGKRYLNDLKIIDGHVIDRWWRQESHTVEAADIDDILAKKPDFLVVGMGKPGRMQTSESLRAYLADARIELIEKPTAEAVKTFNRLHRSGKNVAAAFHLTC